MWWQEALQQSDVMYWETSCMYINFCIFVLFLIFVGFMSTFLHVHPFGASVEYLWSYLQRLDPTTTSLEIELLLNKFPKIFKLELFGVGATLEKRWKFVGFTTCLAKKWCTLDINFVILRLPFYNRVQPKYVWKLCGIMDTVCCYWEQHEWFLSWSSFFIVTTYQVNYKIGVTESTKGAC